jgi:hypothetical protein
MRACSSSLPTTRVASTARAERYGLTPAEDDSYGESIVDVPVAMVWIDRAANPTAARLIRTAAHEALHVAQPALRHGRAFEKSVTCLTKGREP